MRAMNILATLRMGVAVLFGILAVPAAAQFTLALARTVPEAPAAGSPFVLVVTSRSQSVVEKSSLTVQRQGSTLVVTCEHRILDGYFSFPAADTTAGAVIDDLPAGTYSIQYSEQFIGSGNVVRETRGGALASTVTVAAGSPVAPTTAQLAGLSGNWFDPAQPGWGVNLVQGDSRSLFAAWLTYHVAVAPSVDSDPLWLVMSGGRWVSPTRFVGVLYLPAGPSVSQPFNADAVSLQPVGLSTLDFSDSRHMAYSAQVVMPNVSGLVSVQRNLARFDF